MLAFKLLQPCSMISNDSQSKCDLGRQDMITPFKLCLLNATKRLPDLQHRHQTGSSVNT